MCAVCVCRISWLYAVWQDSRYRYRERNWLDRGWYCLVYFWTNCIPCVANSVALIAACIQCGVCDYVDGDGSDARFGFGPSRTLISQILFVQCCCDFALCVETLQSAISFLFHFLITFSFSSSREAKCELRDLDLSLPFQSQFLFGRLHLMCAIRLASLVLHLSFFLSLRLDFLQLPLSCMLPAWFCLTLCSRWLWCCVVFEEGGFTIEGVREKSKRGWREWREAETREQLDNTKRERIDPNDVSIVQLHASWKSPNKWDKVTHQLSEIR